MHLVINESAYQWVHTRVMVHDQLVLGKKTYPPLRNICDNFKRVFFRLTQLTSYRITEFQNIFPTCENGEILDCQENKSNQTLDENCEKIFMFTNENSTCSCPELKITIIFGHNGRLWLWLSAFQKILWLGYITISTIITIITIYSWLWL